MRTYLEADGKAVDNKADHVEDKVVGECGDIAEDGHYEVSSQEGSRG